jgi:hypothetical protein
MKKALWITIVLVLVFGVLGLMVAQNAKAGTTTCSGTFTSVGGHKGTCGSQLYRCPKCGNVGCRHENCATATNGRDCCTNGIWDHSQHCSKCGYSGNLEVLE